MSLLRLCKYFAHELTKSTALRTVLRNLGAAARALNQREVDAALFACNFPFFEEGSSGKSARPCERLSPWKLL